MVCSIWHWNQSVSTEESLLALSCFQILKEYIFLFVGSILLDPSLTQSAGDGQAIIALFPNSPTLNAVNIITSKLLQLESSWDQWLKEQVLSFYKNMVVEYVAFMQLGKCDWDGQVINNWFLLAVPVAYQSNQWWELQQSSPEGYCLDVPRNSQNFDVKRNDGQFEDRSLLKYMYSFSLVIKELTEKYGFTHLWTLLPLT